MLITAVPDGVARLLGPVALAATISLLFFFAAFPVDNDATAASAPEGFSAEGADTCLGCHSNEDMFVLFRTPHGQQADPESPMAQQQCEHCHGPGGEHSKRVGIAGGAHQ